MKTMNKWIKRFEFLWQTGTYVRVNSETYVAVAAISLALGFGGLAAYEGSEAVKLRSELNAVRIETGNLSSVLFDAKLKLKGDSSVLEAARNRLIAVEHEQASCQEAWEDMNADQLQLVSKLDAERKARFNAELLRADAERKMRRQRMTAKIAQAGTPAPKN
jgi:hypothetical protein